MHHFYWFNQSCDLGFFFRPNSRSTGSPQTLTDPRQIEQLQNWGRTPGNDGMDFSDSNSDGRDIAELLPEPSEDAEFSRHQSADGRHRHGADSRHDDDDRQSRIFDSPHDSYCPADSYRDEDYRNFPQRGSQTLGGAFADADYRNRSMPSDLYREPAGDTDLRILPQQQFLEAGEGYIDEGRFPVMDTPQELSMRSFGDQHRQDAFYNQGLHDNLDRLRDHDQQSISFGETEAVSPQSMFEDNLDYDNRRDVYDTRDMRDVRDTRDTRARYDDRQRRSPSYDRYRDRDLDRRY